MALVNLLITSECPNRCPYCFNASTVINPGAAMSIENFKKCLAFLCKSAIKDLRLLGGEPLLHPEISAIANIANNDPKIETTTIFSSLLVNEASIGLFKFSKTRVVANINHPSLYRNNDYDIVKQNIAFLVHHGYEVTLGLNIYQKQFDYLPFLQLAVEFAIPTVRVCIANPSNGHDTETLSFADRKKIGSLLFEMLTNFSKKRINVVFDCVMPLCTFTNEQLGTLTRLYPKIFSSAGTCTPALDIDSNLVVRRCCSLGDYCAVRLEDFNSSKELFEYFVDKIDRFKWFCQEKQCRDCDMYKMRNCQGDCIGFNYLSICDVAIKYEHYLQQKLLAYERLSLKKYDEAESYFEHAVSTKLADYGMIADYLFLLLKMDKLGKCIEVAEDVSKDCYHTHGSYDFVNGLIYEASKQYETALLHYGKALKSIDDNQKEALFARIQKLRDDVSGKK